MTIRGALTTIVGCTLLVAAIGAAVGYALGVLAPGYYRSVFRNGLEPGFDPVSVGVGQGLTQGTAGGVAAGLAVVALLCWRDGRLRPVPEPVAADGAPARSVVTTRRADLVAWSLVVLGFCLGSGIVGGLFGVRDAYHRRFLEEQEAIAPLLAADPAFAGVELGEYSAGGVYLLGEVPTAKDLARLQAGVVRAVGERRAQHVMSAVDVAGSRRTD